MLTTKRVYELLNEQHPIAADKDYDTTVAKAAGVCLQYHHIPVERKASPGGKRRWYRIRIEGGLGGHAATDIGKGHCSTVIPMWALLTTVYNEYDYDLAVLHIGQADDTIASTAEAVVCIPSGEPAEFLKQQQDMMNQWLRDEYPHDAQMTCSIEKCERMDSVVDGAAFEALLSCLEQIPQGIVKMSEVISDTVETSNNVGCIQTAANHIFVSTQTRSFSDSERRTVSDDIAGVFAAHGATSETIVSTPALPALAKLLLQSED